MPWQQVYDPFGSIILSALVAALPVAFMLVAVASFGILVAGLAVLFAAIALPVVIVAGAIGAGSIWWRLRRLRRRSGPGGSGGPGTVQFVVIRR